MTLAGILEDLDTVADAIAIVAIGGSGFYFVKGIVSSSSKGRRRLASGVEVFNANKHRVCHWAAWSGVMTAIELGMEHVRHVEGPLNLMVACGATNALFSMHRGTRAAVQEGLKGAALGGVAGIAVYNFIRVLASPESSEPLTS